MGLKSAKFSFMNRSNAAIRSSPVVPPKPMKIDAAIASGKMQSIGLPKPLPVLVLYWTVDPSPTGGASFHRDIYGRDARLIKALDAPFRP